MTFRLCKLLIAMLLCTTGFVVPLTAMADEDGCYTIAENQTWQTGIREVQTLVENADYENAIKQATPLFGICPGAPELNYYVGISIQNTGDKARALRYFQEAAKGTTDFDVSAVMMRKIWYTLYEVENPDRTEAAVADLNQKIKGLSAENEEQKQTINDLNTDIATVSLYSMDKVNETEQAVKANYARTMWTGTGVGIAGLLIATAGFLMVHFVNNRVDNHTSYKVSPEYIAGWSLFGAGLGLTVAGAITAGIGGYQYTHVTESGDEISMSFGVSPTSAAFSLTF